MRRVSWLLPPIVLLAVAHGACRDGRPNVPDDSPTAVVQPPAADVADAAVPLGSDARTPQPVASAPPPDEGASAHRQGHAIRCGTAECRYPDEICCASTTGAARFACAPVGDPNQLGIGDEITMRKLCPASLEPGPTLSVRALTCDDSEDCVAGARCYYERGLISYCSQGALAAFEAQELCGGTKQCRTRESRCARDPSGLEVCLPAQGPQCAGSTRCSATARLCCTDPAGGHPRCAADCPGYPDRRWECTDPGDCGPDRHCCVSPSGPGLPVPPTDPYGGGSFCAYDCGYGILMAREACVSDADCSEGARCGPAASRPFGLRLCE